jgi:hypothetical protein
MVVYLTPYLFYGRQLTHTYLFIAIIDILWFIKDGYLIYILIYVDIFLMLNN